RLVCLRLPLLWNSAWSAFAFVSAEVSGSPLASDRRVALATDVPGLPSRVRGAFASLEQGLGAGAELASGSLSFFATHAVAPRAHLLARVPHALGRQSRSDSGSRGASGAIERFEVDQQVAPLVGFFRRRRAHRL
ncbi:MAG TPA: hypothetical protein VER33_28205, partial [Polyangiaceae bacterium]|nr:hypothetical protein [Polyangiaceae bacterium]